MLFQKIISKSSHCEKITSILFKWQRILWPDLCFPCIWQKLPKVVEWNWKGMISTNNWIPMKHWNHSVLSSNMWPKPMLTNSARNVIHSIRQRQHRFWYRCRRSWNWHVSPKKVSHIGLTKKEQKHSVLISVLYCHLDFTWNGMAHF